MDRKEIRERWKGLIKKYHAKKNIECVSINVGLGPVVTIKGKGFSRIIRKC